MNNSSITLVDTGTGESKIYSSKFFNAPVKYNPDIINLGTQLLNNLQSYNSPITVECNSKNFDCGTLISSSNKFNSPIYIKNVRYMTYNTTPVPLLGGGVNNFNSDIYIDFIKSGNIYKYNAKNGIFSTIAANMIFVDFSNSDDEINLVGNNGVSDGYGAPYFSSGNINLNIIGNEQRHQNVFLGRMSNGNIIVHDFNVVNCSNNNNVQYQASIGENLYIYNCNTVYLPRYGRCKVSNVDNVRLSAQTNNSLTGNLEFIDVNNFYADRGQTLYSITANLINTSFAYNGSNYELRFNLNAINSNILFYLYSPDTYSGRMDNSNIYIFNSNLNISSASSLRSNIENTSFKIIDSILNIPEYNNENGIINSNLYTKNSSINIHMNFNCNIRLNSLDSFNSNITIKRNSTGVYTRRIEFYNTNISNSNIVIENKDDTELKTLLGNLTISNYNYINLSNIFTNKISVSKNINCSDVNEFEFDFTCYSGSFGIINISNTNSVNIYNLNRSSFYYFSPDSQQHFNQYNSNTYFFPKLNTFSFENINHLKLFTTQGSTNNNSPNIFAPCIFRAIKNIEEFGYYKFSNINYFETSDFHNTALFIIMNNGINGNINIDWSSIYYNFNGAFIGFYTPNYYSIGLNYRDGLYNLNTNTLWQRYFGFNFNTELHLDFNTAHYINGLFIYVTNSTSQLSFTDINFNSSIHVDCNCLGDYDQFNNTFSNEFDSSNQQPYIRPLYVYSGRAYDENYSKDTFVNLNHCYGGRICEYLYLPNNNSYIGGTFHVNVNHVYKDYYNSEDYNSTLINVSYYAKNYNSTRDVHVTINDKNIYQVQSGTPSYNLKISFGQDNSEFNRIVYYNSRGSYVNNVNIFINKANSNMVLTDLQFSQLFEGANLSNMDNIYRRSIYCEPDVYNILNSKKSDNYVFGSNYTVTDWTDMDNEVYNSYYNLYIYNNYI